MSSVTADLINGVLDEVHRDAWHTVREQVSQIEPYGQHRRFVVTRMGYTGSTWLAKLLNSHPDVLCTHECVISRAFPKREFDNSDIIDLIRWLAADSMHDAYLAAGDVGSVWTTHAVTLHGKFSTAALLRHPARVLNTRLRVYPRDQSFSMIPSTSRQTLLRLWDIDIENLSVLDRIFLHDLITFASQVRLIGAVDLVLRIEDLQEPEYCGTALQSLTGVLYPIDIIAHAIEHRVNVGTERQVTIPDILDRFSPLQRQWYDLILRDVAPILGYDLEADRHFADTWRLSLTV